MILFMSNHNDITLAGYNASVLKYIETSPQVVSPDLKTWINKNLRKLGKNPDILEIGSGSGKDAEYFASQGFNMQLTDASQGFVDYLNSRGMNARLLNALSDDLGKNHDMVFADAVFLHFTTAQLNKVLLKVFGSLKINGRVAFSLKIGSGDEITDRKLDVPRYFCYWDSEDITRLLNETGFTQIEIDSVDDYRGKDRNGWLLVDAVRST